VSRASRTRRGRGVDPWPAAGGVAIPRAFAKGVQLPLPPEGDGRVLFSSKSDGKRLSSMSFRRLRLFPPAGLSGNARWYPRIRGSGRPSQGSLTWPHDGGFGGRCDRLSRVSFAYSLFSEQTCGSSGIRRGRSRNCVVVLNDARRTRFLQAASRRRVSGFFRFVGPALASTVKGTIRAGGTGVPFRVRRGPTSPADLPSSGEAQTRGGRCPTSQGQVVANGVVVEGQELLRQSAAGRRRQSPRSPSGRVFELSRLEMPSNGGPKSGARAIV